MSVPLRFFLFQTPVIRRNLIDYGTLHLTTRPTPMRKTPSSNTRPEDSLLLPCVIHRLEPAAAIGVHGGGADLAKSEGVGLVLVASAVAVAAAAAALAACNFFSLAASRFLTNSRRLKMALTTRDRLGRPSCSEINAPTSTKAFKFTPCA